MASGFHETGAHTLEFDAARLGSGVYFYRLEENGEAQARELTVGDWRAGRSGRTEGRARFRMAPRSPGVLCWTPIIRNWQSRSRRTCLSPPPQHGRYPMIPITRTAVLLRALSAACLLFAAVSAPVGRASPPSYCVIIYNSDQTSDHYNCQMVSQVIVAGGNECKPILDMASHISLLGSIPEYQYSCDHQLVESRHWSTRVRTRDGKAPRLDKAGCVPLKVHVKATGIGSAQYASGIAYSGGNLYVEGSGYFTDVDSTVTACVPVALFEKDSASFYTIANGYLFNAVYWFEPVGTTREMQLVVDPFVEVDPSWPDASLYVVEKQTGLSSGDWVEFDREWMADPVPFSDIASGALASGTVSSCAWGDYDLDGDEDLFLGGRGVPGRLMRNDGAGVFTEVAAGPLGNSLTLHGASWVDYDNDGDLDLYQICDLAPNRMVRNDGGGAFTVASVPALEIDGDKRAAAWADYDLDGDLDVYVAMCNAPNRLLRNDGAGTFTNVTPALLANEGNSQGAAWADYDNDGDPDLAMTNWASYTKLLFRNNGVAGFSSVSLPYTMGYGRGVAWGDYDNDGRLDLYVMTDIDGCKLLRNGPTAFADSTSELLGLVRWGRGATWADLDNDGWLDLLGMGYDTLTRALFNNEGRDFEAALYHATGPLERKGLWNTVAACDHDNDGDVDVYFTGFGPNLMPRNDRPPVRHWLEVDLRGVTANRFGIGGRVRVVAGGRAQIREIAVASGIWNGEPCVAHFGLDQDAVVDTLQVRWPGGETQTFGPLPADRRLTVNQSTGISDVDDTRPVPALPALHDPWPNPFNPLTTISFDLPAPATITLAVHDVSGRRVRLLAAGLPLQPGSISLTWDGRDDDGRAVASGVYICRLEADGFSDQRKMALLR